MTQGQKFRYFASEAQAQAWVKEFAPISVCTFAIGRQDTGNGTQWVIVVRKDGVFVGFV